MTPAEQACQRLGIRAQAIPGAERPPVSDDWAPAFSWTVTLSWKGPPPIYDSKAPVRQITVPFYQGAAHEEELSAADVLCCLLADADVVHYASFEEWASDYGYDSDSRQAERIYRACCLTADKLIPFLEGLDEETLQELRDH